MADETDPTPTPEEPAATPPEPVPAASPEAAAPEAAAPEAAAPEAAAPEAGSSEPSEATPAAAESSETDDAEEQSGAERTAFVRKGPSGGFYWGTGRRKSAVASVRLAEGTGSIMVNRKEMKQYFRNDQDREQVEAPLVATEAVGKIDVFVNVKGGGMTGQAGAVKMGLARALINYDANMESALRDHQHLTRDSRMKERKKPGQRGARRKFQFSKR